MIEKLGQDLNFEVGAVHHHIGYLFLVAEISDGLNFEFKVKLSHSAQLPRCAHLDDPCSILFC